MPKHRFIAWLAMRNRLQTRERLFKYNVIHDDCCLICGQQWENVTHLFFECTYSKRCLDLIKQWLGWKVANFRLQQLFRGISRVRYSPFKKQILSMVLTVIVYYLWKNRNEAFWLQKVMTLKVIVSKIKADVKSRISIIKPKKIR